MPTLLHIDASARVHSYSKEIGSRIANAWRDANPEGRYIHRDLATDPVPQITEAWTEICDYILEHEITDTSRYREAVRTPAQQKAWQIIEPLLDELVSADIVLIATPMYNFSIPAALKAWIDQVTFPKMSLAGRRFVVAYARGGAYGPGKPREPYDHQERYLRDFFEGHFAITDATFVGTEMVNSVLDPALLKRRAEFEESRAAALGTALEIGSSL